MIQLIVEEYCHQCPNFEVDHIHIFPSCEHTIKCAHRYKCMLIKEYLEKDDKKCLTEQ